MANKKPKDVYFHGKLREALVDSGLFASTAVDKAMKNVEPDEIPIELQESYFDLMRSAVKLRVQLDPNYPSLKNTGRLEFLDQL